MVKIVLYSQDGKYMREWRAHWYDWMWDYTGIQFTISVFDKNKRPILDKETKVIVKGGIVIIEELNEKES